MGDIALFFFIIGVAVLRWCSGSGGGLLSGCSCSSLGKASRRSSRIYDGRLICRREWQVVDIRVRIALGTGCTCHVSSPPYLEAMRASGRHNRCCWKYILAVPDAHAVAILLARQVSMGVVVRDPLSVMLGTLRVGVTPRHLTPRRTCA